MLFDTHCHLDYLQKNNNLEDILQSAKAAGVGKIITISTLISNFPEIISIAEKFSNVWCTIGTHPDQILSDNFDPSEVIELCKKHSKIIGIGETGLDLYHPENPDINMQIDYLERHIYVAKHLQLPLIFHSRHAEEQSYEVLKMSQNSSLTGVMHCFTGSLDFAKKCIDLGFYISISGIVTFKNAVDLQDLVRNIPLDRLLIETDAPFLAPSPMRGKQNQPAFLSHTAKFISELVNMKLEDFMQNMWSNSHALFTKINN